MIMLVDRGLRPYLSGMPLQLFRLLAFVAVFAAAQTADTARAQIRLQTFEQDQVTVVTENGAQHRFDVELALTNAQHAQGLMYRRKMAEQAGMLFVYGREGPISMWMKNTFIPLDMLFISRDGYIVRVVERAVPNSMETISSGLPVTGVLEVNGGTAARLGIQPGDRVLHRAFDGGS